MKNAVLDCIYSRRSVRDYLDKPVPKEIAEELLNAAVMAPSAMNTQPWHFSVVEGKENVARFSGLALGQRGLLGKGFGLGFKLAGKNSIFYDAPLLVVISGKRDYSYLKDDVNLAVQNMFLAANSLGLGSCWIGFGKPLNENPEARKELGIPDNFEIVAPLIFGYPKKGKKDTPKRTPKVLAWIK